METVGNCQKFGINHGWGYEDRPPLFTSCLNPSNWDAFNLPSRKALAYIPGAEWPWKYIKSPPNLLFFALQKWFIPTS